MRLWLRKIYLLSSRSIRNDVFVKPTTKQMFSKASLLSKELNIPLINHDQPFPLTLQEFYVVQQTPQRLQIALMRQVDGKIKELSSWFSNFEDSHLLNRQKQAQTSKTPLIKALGIHSIKLDQEKKDIFILDGTAGLGEDSFLIASCDNTRVLLIERDPLIYHLLKDGLERGKNSKIPHVSQTIKKMELYSKPLDSFSVLENYNNIHPNFRPDVIYLDPMHVATDTHKSALPKIKMQLARVIAGSGEKEEQQQLLEKALKIANLKVVFKRPDNVPADKNVVSYSGGRVVRYDAYTIK